jgi:hypothetical protein
MAKAQKPDLDEATLQIADRLLNMPRGLGDAKLLKSLGRSFKGRHYRG